MSDRYIIQTRTRRDGSPLYVQRIVRATPDRTNAGMHVTYTSNPRNAMILTGMDLIAIDANQYGVAMPAVN